MIPAILAALAAIVLSGVSIVAVREYVRGRRALATARPAARGDVVACMPGSAGARAAQVRSLAAAAAEAPLAIQWRCGPGDDPALALVDEARRRFPDADLRAVPAPAPERQVAAAARMRDALGDAGSDAIAHVAAEALPASRDLGLALAAAEDRGIVGACPGPSSGMEPGEALAARGLCDQAPLLFAIHGAAGLWPLLVAAPRTAWDRAAADPLAANRPGPAAMLAAKASGQPSLLLPMAVGLAPGCIRDVRRRHLQWIVAHQPGRAVLTATCLAALPGALAAALLAPSGAPRAVSALALAIAALARAIVSATWTRAALGPAHALRAWFLAPWRDLRTLASLLPAATVRRTRVGGAVYRMTPGGILAPEAPARGASSRGDP